MTACDLFKVEKARLGSERGVVLVKTAQMTADRKVGTGKPLLQAKGFAVGGPTNVRTCPHHLFANTHAGYCLIGGAFTTPRLPFSDPAPTPSIS